MADFSYPPAPFPEATPEKQSKWGIAAFVVALIGLFLFCLGFILSFSLGFSLAVNAPDLDPTQIDQSSPLFLIASALFCFVPLFLFASIVLGVVTLVQKTGKKTLGIVALVISGVLLLAFCVLFVIGLVAQAGVM